MVSQGSVHQQRILLAKGFHTTMAPSLTATSRLWVIPWFTSQSSRLKPSPAHQDRKAQAERYLQRMSSFHRRIYTACIAICAFHYLGIKYSVLYGDSIRYTVGYRSLFCYKSFALVPPNIIGIRDIMKSLDGRIFLRRKSVPLTLTSVGIYLQLSSAHKCKWGRCRLSKTFSASIITLHAKIFFPKPETNKLAIICDQSGMIWFASRRALLTNEGKVDLKCELLWLWRIVCMGSIKFTKEDNEVPGSLPAKLYCCVLWFP